MVDISSLQYEITTELAAQLEHEASYNSVALNAKVKVAILDVLGRREYENSHYTDKEILSELGTRYYSTITRLALYDYNQIGAEGQTQHSENSVNRSWVERDKILSDVHPFVKVLKRR